MSLNREAIIHIDKQSLDAQERYAQVVKLHPDRPKSYHIVTFGCQMNTHDSETLSGTLSHMGLSRSDNRESADLVLFNTCCIRDNAERKALGNITWLKEIKKIRPDMLIGICGCMMQQKGMADTVLKKYPFVDLAFGTGTLWRLPEYLYGLVEEKRRVIDVSREESTIAEGLPLLRDSDFKAYINIMYGCNNFCSYCIVPYVRGRERSRQAGDILREAEGLVSDGVKEITLLGQNVNSFGNDTGEMSFPELLRRLEKTGIERLRFMTSHPKDLSDELIEVYGDSNTLAPYLHLPIQSGSNKILKAMNRGYTVENYLEKVSRLRRALPDIGLTSDIIVAFPGETDEDFEQTLKLVETVRYDSAFTFIYSKRIGTRAYDFDDMVAPEVASRRLERLLSMQTGISGEILKSLQGRTMGILVEGVSARRQTQMSGKCERNITVNFTGGDEGLIGQIIPVKITGAGSNTLRGRLEKENDN